MDMFWGLAPGYTQEKDMNNVVRAKVDAAYNHWDHIPMRACYAFGTAARRAVLGWDTRWARRALAMHMGAAAARGDDIGARNIKAMIVACS